MINNDNFYKTQDMVDNLDTWISIETYNAQVFDLVYHSKSIMMKTIRVPATICQSCIKLAICEFGEND